MLQRALKLDSAAKESTGEKEGEMKLRITFSKRLHYQRSSETA